MENQWSFQEQENEEDQKIQRNVPVKDLRYAQGIKDEKGGKRKKVDWKVIFGDHIEQNHISISLLESQNLTFRQDNNESQ